IHGSNLQKGINPYNGSFEPRQQDPIDPSQYLMALPWWLASINVGAPNEQFPFQAPGNNSGMSSHAFAFQYFFHSLADYNGTSTSFPPPNVSWWDWSGTFPRRAYFSKFLIVSSG